MKRFNRYRRVLSAFSLFAFVFGLGLSATPAQAHYNPKLGRFLQRDANGTALVLSPGHSQQAMNPTVTVSMAYELQFGDGMNFYEYLKSTPPNQRDPSGLFSLTGTTVAVASGTFLAGSLIGGTRTALDLIGNRDNNDYTATEIETLISRNAGLTGLTGVAAVLIGAPIVASGAAGAALFAALGLGTSAVGFARGESEIANADDYYELAIGVIDTTTAGVGLLGSAIGLRAAALLRPKVQISRSRYPEAAGHISDAQRAGYPRTLTIDRVGSIARGKAARKGFETKPGMDLDEYPMAMFKEGGAGSSIRPISRFDNRGAGSTIGHMLRSYPDGTKIIIEVVP